MKFARFTLVLLLALASVACAGPTTVADLGRKPTLTERYVHAVNKANRGRPGDVVWVHYPSEEAIARYFGITVEAKGD